MKGLPLNDKSLPLKLLSVFRSKTCYEYLRMAFEETSEVKNSVYLAKQLQAPLTLDAIYSPI